MTIYSLEILLSQFGTSPLFWDSSVQFNPLLSHVIVTPWTASRQASLSITNCWSLPKPMSIESVMPSNHFILYHPLLLLLSIFPSIRVFSNESVLCIRWAEVLEFQLQYQSFQWIFRVDFLRIDWFDLFALQRTLKSPPTPQFKSISSSVLSLLYGPTLTFIHDYWKNHSFD